MANRFTTKDGRIFQFYLESDGDVTYQQIECQPGQFHTGSVGDVDQTKAYLDSASAPKQWEFDPAI